MSLSDFYQSFIKDAIDEYHQIIIKWGILLDSQQVPDVFINEVITVVVDAKKLMHKLRISSRSITYAENKSTKRSTMPKMNIDALLFWDIVVEKIIRLRDRTNYLEKLRAAGWVGGEDVRQEVERFSQVQNARLLLNFHRPYYTIRINVRPNDARALARQNYYRPADGDANVACCAVVRKEGSIDDEEISQRRKRSRRYRRALARLLPLDASNSSLNVNLSNDNSDDSSQSDTSTVIEEQFLDNSTRSILADMNVSDSDSDTTLLEENIAALSERFASESFSLTGNDEARGDSDANFSIPASSVATVFGIREQSRDVAASSSSVNVNRPSDYTVTMGYSNWSQQPWMNIVKSKFRNSEQNAGTLPTVTSHGPIQIHPPSGFSLSPQHNVPERHCMNCLRTAEETIIPDEESNIELESKEIDPENCAESSQAELGNSTTVEVSNSREAVDREVLPGPSASTGAIRKTVNKRKQGAQNRSKNTSGKSRQEKPTQTDSTSSNPIEQASEIQYVPGNEIQIMFKLPEEKSNQNNVCAEIKKALTSSNLENSSKSPETTNIKAEINSTIDRITTAYVSSMQQLSPGESATTESTEIPCTVIFQSPIIKTIRPPPPPRVQMVPDCRKILSGSSTEPGFHEYGAIISKYWERCLPRTSDTTPFLHVAASEIFAENIRDELRLEKNVKFCKRCNRILHISDNEVDEPKKPKGKKKKKVENLDDDDDEYSDLCNYCIIELKKKFDKVL